jgi:cytochrome b6-f complex iron-sulfur subunit
MAEEKKTTEPAPRSASMPQFEVVGEYPPKPGMTRRSFMMSWAGAAWGTFALANAAGLGLCGRFMLPNVLFEPPQVFKAGKIDDFEFDTPSDRYKSSQKCVIVKLRKDWNKKAALIALDITCTHLGCTPNILQSENKIKCPCHGSGFRFDGVNFEGPAPRPLERYKVFVDPVDGLITVDKTKKYHYEKQEWVDPDCYIAL